MWGDCGECMSFFGGRKWCCRRFLLSALLWQNRVQGNKSGVISSLISWLVFHLGERFMLQNLGAGVCHPRFHLSY